MNKHTFRPKLILGSSVKGAILHAGEPLVGVDVIRRITWRHHTFVTRVKTRNDGQFTFDETFVYSLLWGLLPHIVHIKQEIIVEYQGQARLAWDTRKLDYRSQSEAINHDIGVVRELREMPVVMSVNPIEQRYLRANTY